MSNNNNNNYYLQQYYNNKYYNNNNNDERYNYNNNSLFSNSAWNDEDDEDTQYTCGKNKTVDESSDDSDEKEEPKEKRHIRGSCYDSRKGDKGYMWERNERDGYRGENEQDIREMNNELMRRRREGFEIRNTENDAMFNQQNFMKIRIIKKTKDYRTKIFNFKDIMGNECCKSMLKERKNDQVNPYQPLRNNYCELSQANSIGQKNTQNHFLISNKEQEQKIDNFSNQFNQDI